CSLVSFDNGVMTLETPDGHNITRNTDEIQSVRFGEPPPAPPADEPPHPDPQSGQAPLPPRNGPPPPITKPLGFAEMLRLRWYFQHDAAALGPGESDEFRNLRDRLGAPSADPATLRTRLDQLINEEQMRLDTEIESRHKQIKVATTELEAKLQMGALAKL